MKTICVECLYCVPVADNEGDEHYICTQKESDKFLKEIEPNDHCEKAVEDADYDGEFDELWEDDDDKG